MGGGGALISTVVHVFLQRARLRWGAWAVTGLVLGIGFGVSFASFAAARQTASSFGRILEEADSKDGTISYPAEIEDVPEQLRQVGTIARMQHSVGFVGYVDELDPQLARGFLASIDGTFPLEIPFLEAGRMPNQDVAEEVFVNSYIAERAGLQIGDRLTGNFFASDFQDVATTELTLVGIGTLSRELVVDETGVIGIVLLTTAFAEAHEANQFYAQSNVELRPGATESQLAAEVAELGFELQERRSQNENSVNQALRPLLVVVIALGLLAFVATLVAASQLLQRERDRWRSADATLVALGVVPSQVLQTHLAYALFIAPIAIVAAVVTMWLASPIAPVGPLHDYDPARGLSLDLTVAAIGVVVIAVLLCSLTAVHARPKRNAAVSARLHRTSRPPIALPMSRPAALAGLALGLGGGSRRRTLFRSIGTATTAIALTAFVATAVTSARVLTETPARYGLQGDVVAVNPYGDQTVSVLEEMFGGDDDVDSIAGYHGLTFLVDSHVVAGMTATQVKGEVWPTILRGEPPRTQGEIVLGADTLSLVGADVGDDVGVQIVNFDGTPVAGSVDLRIVGVATFAPVVQPGFDQARLGSGVIIDSATFGALQGDVSDDPEWSVIDLADGVDADRFIARHPDGIPDELQIATSWFTDARPSEIRQLQSVMPYLAGAVGVAYVVVLAVLAHALWSQSRARRRELAVLQAMGLTRRQMGEVVGWQSVPLALVALVVGTPVGILLGRWGFSAFARSFDVVDTPSTPLLGVLAFVGAIILATAIGHLAARAVARAVRPSLVLRQQ